MSANEMSEGEYQAQQEEMMREPEPTRQLPEVRLPKMAELSPEYAEIMVLGNVLHKSGYFRDVQDQAQAVTKILFGREIGFSPIVSMGGIHIIEGKPALSSNLMAALIKRSGKYDYRVKTWDVNQCVLSFREKCNGKWEEVGEASFSIPEARTAGIQFVTKNGHPTSWTKFPKAMLFARALSQGLRAYCPDVSASPIYVPEELGATVNEDGDVQDLPKAAKKHEVTDADIVIERPKAKAQEGGGLTSPDVTKPRGSGDGPTPATAGGHPGKPSAEAVEPGATNNVPSTAPAQPEDLSEDITAMEEAKAKKPKEPPTSKSLGDEYIGQGQATNFEIAFKNALPKAKQGEARKLAHDWLGANGFVDTNGNPTAYAIKKADFYDVREKAEQAARNL